MIIDKYGDCKLNSYEDVTIVLPVFKVTEEEIKAEMERLAARHAATKTTEAHPVEADDLVQITIRTVEGNKPFPGLTREMVDVRLGIGSLPQEVELAMLGRMPGDTVTAEYEYEDYSSVAMHVEKPVEGGCGGSGDNKAGEPEAVRLLSTVQILAIRELVIPTITDEWVKDHIALSNSVQEFSERTAAKLKQAKRNEYLGQIEHEILEILGSRLEDEVPVQDVDNTYKQLLFEFDAFLKQYELNKETYLKMQGISEEEFSAQVRQDARERVTQDIAVAAYARAMNVTIDDGDIDFMFTKPTPELTAEARIKAESTGEIEGIKDLALRYKVARRLAENATFVSASGDIDERFATDIKIKYSKLKEISRHVSTAPRII